jgi:hypothetical protein
VPTSRTARSARPTSATRPRRPSPAAPVPPVPPDLPVPPVPAGPKGDQGPQGPAGTPDGYTKTEADAAFLGKGAKAADADKLDGVDGDDYAAGDAQISWAAFTRPVDSGTFTLATLPGLGRLRGTCNGNLSQKTITFENESGSQVSALRTVLIEGQDPLIFDVDIPAGQGAPIVTSTDSYQMTLHLLRGPESGLASADFVTLMITAQEINGPCTYQVQTIHNERDATPLVINP